MRKRITTISLALLLAVTPIFSLTPPTWQSHLRFETIDIPLDPEIQEFTYYLADEYGVDFYLVLAIMQTESNYRANLISRTNDYGLMQINRVNHGWLATNLHLSNMLDPYQNIRAGVYMLSDLFEKYGTTERVLMAYNLGESGANALWRGGVYETGYVRAVKENMEELK